MVVYKLRHKPTGLFFQPSRSHGNLSTKGKIYTKPPSLKWVETIRISMWKGSRNWDLITKHFPVEERYGRINSYVKTNPSDWEIIEL